MVNKHMRRCSSSYVTTKMKIKTAMRFCYIQMRTVKTQNTDDTQHQQGERWVGQQEPPSLCHNATSSKLAEDLALFIFSFKSCLFVCLLWSCMFTSTVRVRRSKNNSLLSLQGIHRLY